MFTPAAPENLAYAAMESERLRALSFPSRHRNDAFTVNRALLARDP